MPNMDFGRDLMLSLPPMESKELAIARNDLTQLDAFDEDFIKQLNARTCSIETSEKEGSLMKAIQEKLKDYQGRYTAKDLTTRLTLQPDAQGHNITAKTYVENLDLQNCRTGGWSTEWTITPCNETNVDVTGTAHMHLHYYEGGSNMQLRATRQYPPRTVGTEEEAVHAIVAKLEARNMSYDEKIAKAVGKEIAAREQEFYDQMKGVCEDVDSSLKKMRRILPITKTRFQWNGAAQKQVRLLNDRKTS